MPMHRPTWVEIDLDNVAHNVQQIKKRIGDDVALMACVKGEGYGHGGYEVARIALLNGAERLAVAMLDEGVVLRRKGITEPILILGMSHTEFADEIVEYDLMQAVCNEDIADALSNAAVRQNKEARVHLKVDTGMNRIGVRPEQIVELARKVLSLPSLVIEGVFTHFASTYYEQEFAGKQFERFQEALTNLEEAGIDVPNKHCSNSGAVLNFPHTYLNQVRPGSILTSPVKAQTPEMEMDLRYSFSWKTRVVFLHDMKEGESLGYNLVYTADSDRKIAVLPVGWADGLPADLTNRGVVLIQGKRCPIRGRICMDQTMVDVTELDAVAVGDEVVLLGKQGEQEISHLEWTATLGGYNNHIVIRCLVTNRVPRVYYYQGKKAGVKVPLRPELDEAIQF